MEHIVVSLIVGVVSSLIAAALYDYIRRRQKH